MSAHTPGPWTLEERDRIAQHGAYAHVGPFVIVAEGEAVATVEDDGEPGEAEANARLIAAAPRLLAACKDMLATIEGIYQGDADDPIHAMGPKWRAVIQQAEGREP